MRRNNKFAISLTDLLNKEIRYKCKNKNVVGVIVDIRHSMASIMNMKTKEEFPAAEFKIKPSDGSRAFWTKPFKNI